MQKRPKYDDTEYNFSDGDDDDDDDDHEDYQDDGK